MTGAATGVTLLGWEARAPRQEARVARGTLVALLGQGSRPRPPAHAHRRQDPRPWHTAPFNTLFRLMRVSERAMFPINVKTLTCVELKDGAAGGMGLFKIV